MNQRSESGYSLVEVLVAMGIFGALVLSVLTLFYWGRTNVYSGKKMTEAVMASTKITEDLSGMTRDQIYSAFNITGATALATVTVDGGSSYPSSIKRDTNTISAATEAGFPTGILSRWRAVINPAGQMPRFNRGRVELVITPQRPNIVAQPITSAGFLKLRLIVSWNEDSRRRRVIFDTTRAQAF